MFNRHMERCSVSLNIRELQMKATMRLSPSTGQKGIIKMSKNDKCWRRCGENGTLLHCW